MTEPIPIAVQRLPNAAGVPVYAHDGDAGADLLAAEDVTLAPGERVAVATGIAIAIPEGYVGLVHPRSGLALRHGLGLVNAPGTIDAGYRGEIKVIVINLDPAQPIILHRGDRIAQLLVQRVERAEWVEVNDLSDSQRGSGGFGSTGGWTHHGGAAAESDLPERSGHAGAGSDSPTEG